MDVLAIMGLDVGLEVLVGLEVVGLDKDLSVVGLPVVGRCGTLVVGLAVVGLSVVGLSVLSV